MTSETSEVKVWDLAVRIFHWSLASLFFFSYFTGDDDSTLHVYSGYAIIGLIAFRAIWGIIGTRYARFNNFIYGLDKTKEYTLSLLKFHPKHYIGHNPLGGWMIFALLISLSLTSWSGLEAYGSKGYGPLATSTELNRQQSFISNAFADDDEAHDAERHEHDGDEFWEEVHEFFANFTLFLVIVHLAGVLVSSLLHGENLIQAMITGRKKQP
ncbi:cytochrome b/b6 domain-containing protein [Thiomicrorhabdus sp. zzn3]|uniref:cytochrome b/b6 domain-containing protein n=1 Tax=Thiomicrorhabdus sp. zzn3 TaxID=3039775 RepID=UPI002436A3DB|nr:cytochrome b/b6 domain-containing protein [Thiomicrorhabdus sp. zzn3]MDG6779084.1 cytochrome b/b6 domain-containing protein [Thiomicrorhabdus sp. zzn3]